MNTTQVLSGSEDSEFKRQLKRAKIGAELVHHLTKWR